MHVNQILITFSNMAVFTDNARLHLASVATVTHVKMSRADIICADKG